MYEHYRQFIVVGGWGMVLIAPLAALALAVAIERALVLYARRPDPDALLVRARTALSADDLSLALRLCARADAPVARVLAAGLRAADAPRAAAYGAVSVALAGEQSRLARRTPYLPAFANLAVLAGLFGTLTGLVGGFGCCGGCCGGPSVDPGCRAQMIIGGLGEAMHCNAAGLGVALAALVAHALLRRRADAVEAELDLVAQAALNLLDERRARRGAALHDAMDGLPRDA